MAYGPAALFLLAGCMAKGPAGTEQSRVPMNEMYKVIAINGEAPASAVGRGNRYEVRLLESGISFSLGCSTVAIGGSVIDGVFRASDPINGGIVTGSGTCGIPVERQWESRLHRSLLAGEVRVTKRTDAVTLAAPNLIVEGRVR